MTFGGMKHDPTRPHANTRRPLAAKFARQFLTATAGKRLAAPEALEAGGQS
jgi:hypothetical protein